MTNCTEDEVRTLERLSSLLRTLNHDYSQEVGDLFDGAVRKLRERMDYTELDHLEFVCLTENLAVVFEAAIKGTDGARSFLTASLLLKIGAKLEEAGFQKFPPGRNA